MKKISTFLSLLFLFIVEVKAQTITRTWDFSNPIVSGKADGWNIYAYGSPNVVSGILNLTATRNGYCDINFVAPDANSIVDPAVSKRFVIRVKNGTKDRIANFIWTTEAGDKKLEILVSTEDLDFKEYVLDMTHDLRWAGNISKLKIQLPIPINAHSDGLPIQIDYIRFTEALSTAQLPTLVAKNPAPFGVNLSGGEFSFNAPASSWRYPRTQELDYLASKGFKLIRLPFLWERVQPTLNGPLDEESLSHLKNIVWAARTRGIWVMLDLHNYNRRRFVVNNEITDKVIGTPEAPITAIQDFWKKMAFEFNGFDNIYAHGIMNEPYSIPKDIPWVNTAQAIIDAIRTEDTQTTIMVGGDSYSSASSWVSASDNLRKLVDPSNNLMFEAHSYFDKNSAGEYSSYVLDNANAQTGVNRVTPFVEWLKKYNLRGIMGEYGIPNNPNGDSDKADAADNSLWNTVLNNTLQYLKDNGVNGTYWSYGTSWGTYKLNVFPNSNGTERPQMQVLANHLFANAPSNLPGINSPLAVGYNIAKPVIYKPTATNNPTSFTVTQLPTGLTYNSTTKEITGTIPAGVHTIKVKATNANGIGEERDVVLRGTALKIPGIIEAENYDGGGQNVGYFDKCIGNTGNFIYRDEDVDFRRSNTSPNYIYSVTSTMAGEWLKYTTNVQQAASYRVKLRYATTTAGGMVNLKVNNTLVAENIVLPVTANLNTWVEKLFEIPNLTVGEHVFTLEVVSGDFDFDRMDFSVVVPAVTPTNLTAAAYGSAKVNLNWNASSNATSYKLERSESANGTFNVIAQNLTQTTFEDETVAPATTYYYRVKGVNILGDGPASANITATTAAFTIPTKVAGVTAVGGNAFVSIDWTTQIDVTEYLVKRAATTGGPYTTIATVTTTPYNDETVANNNTYYYVVSAKNSLGEGVNSDEIIATPSNVDYAYWTFDHGNTTTSVTDSWGPFNGSFDPAVIIGTNTSTSDITFNEPVNSKLNNSIRFRGKARSYVKLPTGIMSDVNDFTISLWYRQVANMNGARIFDFGVGEDYDASTPNSARKMMFLIPRSTATGNRITYGIQNGGTLLQLEGNVTLANAQWYHIVITQTGNTLTMYVDGTQVGQKTDMTIKPSDLGNTTVNYLGRSRFTTSSRIDGVLDEFKIYNKAMSSTEVTQLSASVLPVAFLDFSAQKQNTGGVVLNWNTSSEKNNSHFEVLRSNDGKLFDNIAHVNGSLNTDDLKNYQFVDLTPKLGINYYSLKQVDLDGKTAFHPKTLAISAGLDNHGYLKMYAVGEKLNLQVNTIEAANFEVFLSDMTGRIVAKFGNKVVPGNNVFEFLLPKFGRGIYVATYTSKGERKSIKLMIN